jgi:hypothetical protein
LLEQPRNLFATLLRQAWDTGQVRDPVKNGQAQTRDAHVSLLGHLTADELRRCLAVTKQAFGLGGRLLWLLVKRSKVLPEGGQGDGAGMSTLQGRFRQAVQQARATGAMGFDEEARSAWHALYADSSAGTPGLAGALLARAEVQVRRLACPYALLDLSAVVRRPHLQAALSLWQYGAALVRWLFGESLGDPLADHILQALQGWAG